MTKRIRKPFRLQVLELERRDTPAWWTVTAPTPPEGTLGDTAATHSGELTLNPDLVAWSGGV